MTRSTPTALARTPARARARSAWLVLAVLAASAAGAACDSSRSSVPGSSARPRNEAHADATSEGRDVRQGEDFDSGNPNNTPDAGFTFPDAFTGWPDALPPYDGGAGFPDAWSPPDYGFYDSGVPDYGSWDSGFQWPDFGFGPRDSGPRADGSAPEDSGFSSGGSIPLGVSMVTYDLRPTGPADKVTMTTSVDFYNNTGNPVQLSVTGASVALFIVSQTFQVTPAQVTVPANGSVSVPMMKVPGSGDPQDPGLGLGTLLELFCDSLPLVSVTIDLSNGSQATDVGVPLTCLR